MSTFCFSINMQDCLLQKHNLLIILYPLNLQQEYLPKIIWTDEHRTISFVCAYFIMVRMIFNFIYVVQCCNSILIYMYIEEFCVLGFSYSSPIVILKCVIVVTRGPTWLALRSTLGIVGTYIYMYLGGPWRCNFEMDVWSVTHLSLMLHSCSDSWHH